MACCPAREQSVTLMSPEAMHVRQALPNSYIAAVLHSHRRFCSSGYPTSLRCGHGANYGRPNARYCPLGQLDDQI
jgi:hypothetical protein